MYMTHEDDDDYAVFFLVLTHDLSVHEYNGIRPQSMAACCASGVVNTMCARGNTRIAKSKEHPTEQ